MDDLNWSDIPIEEQKRLLNLFGNDGHTIYGGEFLTNNNVPTSIMRAFGEEIESDTSSPRTTIYRDGIPVKSMKGVYGLRVLWSLADHYKITSSKMGRGFQAQDLTEQLNAKLNKEN